MVFFLYNYPMNNILDKEVWKDIIGYEGLYQVSNLGNVRSLNYNGVKGNIRILTPLHVCGYLYVHLSKDGFIKTVRIHRLVAEAFIPNPDNLPCVNHKDECKTNNIWTNLEWCTIEYNTRYGTGIERRVKKQLNKHSAEPIKQMNLDGTLVTIWPSMRETSRNGFDMRAVYRCCNNKQQTHLGYKWAYL